ncbi:MAG: hypothetical protein AAGB22_03580 [Bacteroidota bacterium]
MMCARSSCLAAFLLLCCAGPAAAQDLVDGWVRTNAGDTLRGLLQLGSPVANQRMVWLHAPDGQKTLYSIKQIRAYGFRGDRGSEVYLRKASKHFLAGDSLLLHRVEQGTLTLYEYYYEFRGNLQPTQSGVAMPLIQQGSEPLVRVRKTRFRKQVKALVADHPTLPDGLDEGRYTWNDLPEVIASYNQWRSGLAP